MQLGQISFLLICQGSVRQNMARAVPSRFQNFLSSVILPCLSILLLHVSLVAVAACVMGDSIRGESPRKIANQDDGFAERQGMDRRCVIITGGRMSKGLT
jgi:hypothetical protein